MPKALQFSKYSFQNTVPIERKPPSFMITPYFKNPRMIVTVGFEYSNAEGIYFYLVKLMGNFPIIVIGSENGMDCISIQQTFYFVIGNRFRLWTSDLTLHHDGLTRNSQESVQSCIKR